MLPITSDIANLITNPVKGVTDLLSIRTTGAQLKHDLGLENYPFVLIQKLINSSVHFYIISYDSRRPSLYLSPFRVKATDTTQLRQIKQHGQTFLMKKFKTTPPVLLDRTNIIMSGAVVVVRDLVGDYIKDRRLVKKMNESVNDYIVLDYNLS